jgi:hypothetical protein
MNEFDVASLRNESFAPAVGFPEFDPFEIAINVSDSLSAAIFDYSCLRDIVHVPSSPYWHTPFPFPVLKKRSPMTFDNFNKLLF